MKGVTRLVFFFTFVIPVPISAQGNLELHFIDVGQGDSTLIICPAGPAILVDGGTLPSSQKNPQKLRQYILDNLGNRFVETVVVSHADSDHYNMLQKALRNLQLKTIIYAGEGYNFWMRRWLRRAATDSFRLEWDAQAKTWYPTPSIDCGNARVTVLAAGVPGTAAEMGNYPWPDAWNKNSASIVLQVSYGTFDAILAADATRDTEKDILRRSNPPQSVEVLKIGHHGSSSTSTSVEWASALSPEIAIASCGRCNTYEHPAKTVVERLASHVKAADPHPIWLGLNVFENTPCSKSFAYEKDYSKAIYSTAASGTVVVTTDGKVYSLDFRP